MIHYKVINFKIKNQEKPFKGFEEFINECFSNGLTLVSYSVVMEEMKINCVFKVGN